MNPKIELDEIARQIVDKSWCRCDLYWPDQKIAVEYDSTQMHSSRSSLREDSLRRDALRRMGVEVLTLTDVQVYNKRKFDAFATTLAAQLGKTIRPTSPHFCDREYELRKQLLG